MTTLLDESGKITKIITHRGPFPMAEFDINRPDAATAPGAQRRRFHAKPFSGLFVIDQVQLQEMIHLLLALLPSFVEPGLHRNYRARFVKAASVILNGCRDVLMPKQL